MLREKRSVFFYRDLGLELLIENNSSRISFEWSTGETEDTQIRVSKDGLYSAIVSNQNCSSYADYPVEEYCPGKLFIPNSFTPNDDGMNEYFTTKGFNIEDFEIWIYNRWGELIYTSTDMGVWWDGTYMGYDCQIDVYVWKAKYSVVTENGDMDNFQKVGRVSLIR
jgi:gliding motility-associated-like protein